VTWHETQVASVSGPRSEALSVTTIDDE